jgi:hypothetical protein
VTLRLVDSGRGNELTGALRIDSSALRIICPVIDERGKIAQDILDKPDWPTRP